MMKNFVVSKFDTNAKRVTWQAVEPTSFRISSAAELHLHKQVLREQEIFSFMSLRRTWAR